MKYNFLLEEGDRIRCSHYTNRALSTDMPLSKAKVKLLIRISPKYLLHSYSLVCSACRQTLNKEYIAESPKNI